MCSTNCTKHFFFVPVKFNPEKFFFPCLINRRTRNSSHHFLFCICRAVFHVCLLFGQKKRALDRKARESPASRIDGGDEETRWQAKLLFSTFFYASSDSRYHKSGKKNTAHDKFNASSWTSVSWVLVVQVQNRLVLDEWTRKRFFPV